MVLKRVKRILENGILYEECILLENGHTFSRIPSPTRMAGNWRWQVCDSRYSASYTSTSIFRGLPTRCVSSLYQLQNRNDNPSEQLSCRPTFAIPALQEMELIMICPALRAPTLYKKNNFYICKLEQSQQCSWMVDYSVNCDLRGKKARYPVLKKSLLVVEKIRKRNWHVALRTSSN